MKFRVIGSNRETGARTSMEFEAESKAAAERKALGAGMTVTRVEDISDGGAPKHAIVPGGSRKPAGGSGLFKLIVVLAIAALFYVYRAKLKAMIGH